MIIRYLMENEEEIKLSKMSIYLCVAVSTLGRTERLHHHQKAWSKLGEAYDLSNFVLGYEYEFEMENQQGNYSLYGAIAKVELSDLEKAFEVMNTIRKPLSFNVRPMFLLLSFSADLTSPAETKRIFDSLAQGNAGVLSTEFFDFTNLFKLIKEGETIITPCRFGYKYEMSTTIFMKGSAF
jgi:hypothetical protein